MSQTLYRKYRPGSFAELIGQNHIKTTLQNEIMSGQLAHAYLFSGPRGTGKTTVARLLAKAINCKNRKDSEAEPCGECLSCQEIKDGKSLDVIEIDAASHTGVDNVRENIIENARFTSYRDKNKVFIIDEVHMLSTSAFNALLKTLEEPPAHAVFVLATTELYKLPETIVSRCQRFDFKKVDLKILAEYLEKISSQEKIVLHQDVAIQIARLSGGFVRDSLSLLGQILSLGKKEIKSEDAEAILPRMDDEMVANLVEILARKDARGGVEIINQLVEIGVDLENFTLQTIDYLRNLALAKLKVENFLGVLNEKQIYAAAENISMQRILEMTNKFMAVLPVLRQAEMTQLPLEMLVIELAGFESNNEVVLMPNKKEVSRENFLKKKKTEDEGVNKICDEELKYEEIKEEDEVTEQTDFGPVSVSLDEIKKRWGELITGSREFNHSIGVALKTARAVRLDGNSLEIAFEHDFYLERFKDIKMKHLLSQALKKVFGCDLMIKCSKLTEAQKVEITKQREARQAEDDEKLNSVLAGFGGKVIN